MNINRYVLCKERSLQKIISKQPKPNTTAIGVCSETQVTHHIITKRSDECLPISAYVPKHKEGDGKKFPVIIDIYGGDFVAGRSALNRNFGAWCAEHGYLTFIPEYTPVPETNLFGQLGDLLKAFVVIHRCYAWLDMRPEYGYKDIGSIYGKPNPYKPLPVSNYNHTVRFLLGFLYFYNVDLTPGYQSRYAWNEARKVAYLADIFAGKDAGEIVFQEIPSSDTMPKYQLIKGEQEAITLREFYENRLLYKKACYNDIRAEDISWFKYTMLRMIVYDKNNEPSTTHDEIPIIGRVLFGGY